MAMTEGSGTVGKGDDWKMQGKNRLKHHYRYETNIRCSTISLL